MNRNNIPHISFFFKHILAKKCNKSRFGVHYWQSNFCIVVIEIMNRKVLTCTYYLLWI